MNVDLPDHPQENIVIFIPGYMGSRLRNRITGETVWIDIQKILKDPLEIHSNLIHLFKQMKFPNDDLVPDGIVEEILFIPPFLKQKQYGPLIDTLKSWGFSASMGKKDGKSSRLYTFAYDWRQDNRESARKLSALVRFLNKRHPNALIWIIAHSNGGTVARWYIEKEGGKEFIDRLFLIACPWDGAPKSIQTLLQGPEVFFLRLFNQFGIQHYFQETALTFPSFYQLIPGFLPFLKQENGSKFDPFIDQRWLSNSRQRDMLENARNFYEELGMDLSVETLCFFGINQPTVSEGVVSQSASGKINNIRWIMDEEGDGTIPVHSAVHPNASQKLPYSANHGDICNYTPMLEKLKFELIQRYTIGELAAVPTSRIKVNFDSDRDMFLPGEVIPISIMASSIDTGLPIYDLHVEVNIHQIVGLENYKWIEYPDQSETISEPVLLVEAIKSPGRYEARVTAPARAGYYEMTAKIKTKEFGGVDCRRLILIEGDKTEFSKGKIPEN